MARICFYGKFTGRGAEKATVNLANLLSESNVVHLLNNSVNGLTYSLSDKVRYQSVPYASVPSIIKHLRQYLKDNSIDFLIAVESLTGITALPAAIICHTKCIIWDHGNYYQNKTSSNMNAVRRLELLFCDAFVVLTKRDRELYLKHFSKIRTKLVRIYNSAELIPSQPYDVKSKRIISVGHIDKNKNFIIIPEIASILFKEHAEWVWDIYGSGSQSDCDELMNAISAYGLEEKVCIKGFEKDVSQVYKGASLCVMTSIHEGFPLTLIEAKACGLPVISFDIDTGPDEIIRDGVNGYLIEAFDKKAMTIKILQLMENEQLRKDFSDNSYLDLANLSPDVIVKEWTDLFNSF